MTRAQWDFDLSELCGGSTDPDAGALANRIEMTVRRYERALEAIVEMSGDQPARTAWNMVHLARSALAASDLKAVQSEHGTRTGEK